MIERTFINDTIIDGEPFNTLKLTFGVYDHIVFQILFYLIAATLAIACVYISAYLIKKLIVLFKKNI
ncbi:MAG: hypothetical protein WDA65_02065 [Christensenellales bacterium]